MDETVPFGSRGWVFTFLLLLFARGMDFLSTWIATPNMVLEGNPIAKRLGWKGGIPLNLALCFLFASWPMPAIIISTTSVLVAGRNFQAAWLMRSLGEQRYRDWHIARLQETSIGLYLFCLFGQTFLFAAVGAALVYFADNHQNPLPMAIGLGIIGYAAAVLFFTLYAVLRLRRSSLREERARRSPNGDSKAPLFGPPGNAIDPWSAGSGWERE
jgi:hypothetical protein